MSQHLSKTLCLELVNTLTPWSTVMVMPTVLKNTPDPTELPEDAPAHHLVSGRTVSILLPLTIVICVICTHVAFGTYIPISLNILAILLALVLSIMGVRALGETDLNPVSGISKLTQLIFALVVPTTGVHKDHAIIINLLAGAVSEAGALQAGDILQDLKAGHLIGASPKAQFYGQIIGSVLGAFVSAVVYKLYVSVYEIPGDVFQVPTAYVWIFTARLVTGRGLPEMAGQFALIFGVVFMFTTGLRIYLASHESRMGPQTPPICAWRHRSRRWNVQHAVIHIGPILWRHAESLVDQMA